jgi:membrane associated rhomboid family serine protease
MEERSYPVEYKAAAEKAWIEGDFCRPISEICNEEIAMVFGHAGNLAIVGTLCLATAQGLLLAYQFLRSKYDMQQFLQASLVAASGAWFFLFVSWTVFQSSMGDKATCIVPDMSGVGVVTATGAFKDITDGGGSYSFYSVIISWAVSTVMIGLLAHRVVSDIEAQKQTGTEAQKPTGQKAVEANDADLKIDI